MEISYNVISLGTNSHNIMIHTMIQHNRKYATFSSTVCPQCVDMTPISLSFLYSTNNETDNAIIVVCIFYL